MKIETEFNKYGWKLIIRKSKDGVVTISQRNKDTEIHMIHKPMELRLQPEEFCQLKKLIKQLEETKKAEEKI